MSLCAYQYLQVRLSILFEYIPLYSPIQMWKLHRTRAFELPRLQPTSSCGERRACRVKHCSEILREPFKVRAWMKRDRFALIPMFSKCWLAQSKVGGHRRLLGIELALKRVRARVHLLFCGMACRNTDERRCLSVVL